MVINLRLLFWAMAIAFFAFFAWLLLLPVGSITANFFANLYPFYGRGLLAGAWVVAMQIVWDRSCE